MHHGRTLWPRKNLLPHLPTLLILRSLNSLINRQNHAGQLIGSLEIVLLDQKRLPDEILVSILDKVNIIEHIDSPALPVSLLGMDPPQLIENIIDWETSILGQTPGNDLKSLGISMHDEMLLSLDLSGLHSEELGELHLNGAPSGDDLIGLGDSSDDHNGVIETPLGLLEKLLGTSPEDNGGGFTLGTSSEEVIPGGSDSLLLEQIADSQVLRSQVIKSGENSGPSGFLDSSQVLLVDSSCAEDVSVSEVLSGQVSNW